VKAITLVPGKPSTLRLDELPDPRPGPDELLVEILLAGVCGTDHDILEGVLGYPASGQDRLILGHEAVGRVTEAPAGSGFETGELVAPIVRRPDPIPCPNCAAGEWDMCRNGRFTEAGIRGLDGYAAERVALPVDFAVRVGEDPGLRGVLVEPASVVAKAWEHIIHVGNRAAWRPSRVLVTGAGPIGLLAALFATRHSDEVEVLDLAKDGPKPNLVRDLEAGYHSDGPAGIEPGVDVVLECTGDPEVVAAALGLIGPNGILCLVGVPDEGSVNIGTELARGLVLHNQTLFGTVNANRRHYEQAARVLAEADQAWLKRMVNRRVPLGSWEEAYRPEPDDVKTVVGFDAAS